MSFLYYYDLVDFDKNGNVKETKTCADLKKVTSNFIYLICKYNQNILHEKVLKTGKKMELSPFFKEGLGDLLDKVEKGRVSKEFAILEVAEKCLPEVKKICKEAINDREILTKLNSLVDINSQEYAKKFKTAVNKKQLEYIMTHISSQLMDEINALLKEGDEDKKIKSTLYKKIISYNGIVNAVTNLAWNEDKKFSFFYKKYP